MRRLCGQTECGKMASVELTCHSGGASLYRMLMTADRDAFVKAHSFCECGRQRAEHAHAV